MTLGGWLTMTLSVGFVTVLFGWCVYRVLRASGDEDHYAHVEPVEEEDVDRR